MEGPEVLFLEDNIQSCKLCFGVIGEAVGTQVRQEEKEGWQFLKGLLFMVCGHAGKNRFYRFAVLMPLRTR